MFGFGKKDSQAEKDREAAIEREKQVVRDFVQKIASATPEDAERKHQQLKDWCNADKLLPFEFKRKALVRAKVLECSVNMRKSDELLDQATTLAMADKMVEKHKAMGEARRHYGRACKLGAEEDWRKAYQRAEETLQLTGGMKHDAPSRAKPADHAPLTPNRAKA